MWIIFFITHPERKGLGKQGIMWYNTIRIHSVGLQIQILYKTALYFLKVRNINIKARISNILSIFQVWPFKRFKEYSKVSLSESHLDFLFIETIILKQCKTVAVRKFSNRKFWIKNYS